MPDQQYQLLALARGAIPELFEREFQAVLANADDTNTKPKAKRSVTVKVTVEPMTDDRETLKCEVEVSSSLAGVKPRVDLRYLVRDGDRYVARGDDPRQTTLDDEARANSGADATPPTGDNVTPMRPRAASGGGEA